MTVFEFEIKNEREREASVVFELFIRNQATKTTTLLQKNKIINWNKKYWKKYALGKQETFFHYYHTQQKKPKEMSKKYG